jgi:hypothetical protein
MELFTESEVQHAFERLRAAHKPRWRDTMAKDYHLSNEDVYDVALAIRHLEAAHEDGDQYKRVHLRRHMVDAERQEVLKAAAQAVDEHVAKARRFGKEALKVLEERAEELRAQARRDLGPTNSDGWAKAAAIRQAMEPKIANAKPEEIVQMFKTAHGSIERGVIMDLAGQRLEAIKDATRSDDPSSWRRSAQADEARKAMEAEHFAAVDAIHAENVAAIEAFRRSIAKPYGELDEERQEREIRERFGMGPIPPTAEEREAAWQQVMRSRADAEHIVSIAQSHGFVEVKDTPDPAA